MDNTAVNFHICKYHIHAYKYIYTEIITGNISYRYQTLLSNIMSIEHQSLLQQSHIVGYPWYTQDCLIGAMDLKMYHNTNYLCKTDTKIMYIFFNQHYAWLVSNTNHSRFTYLITYACLITITEAMLRFSYSIATHPLQKALHLYRQVRDDLGK